MLLGLRIRALREKQHLTQAAVDKRAGLSPSCLSRIETGHTVPSIETLTKISNALEIPLYVFFQHEDKERLSESRNGSRGRFSKAIDSSQKDKGQQLVQRRSRVAFG